MVKRLSIWYRRSGEGPGGGHPLPAKRFWDNLKSCGNIHSEGITKWQNFSTVQESARCLQTSSRNSEEQLYLISPYIHLTAINKKYIQDRDGKNFDIHVIHRSDAPLKEEDKKFLENLSNVTIYACDDLHAKCYLNENTGVISTMNMYEHSQTSNWEMGVKFSKEEDAKQFSDTLAEIGRIVNQSKKTSEIKSAPKPQYQKQQPERAKKQQTINPNLKNPLKKGFLDKLADSILGEVGFCIRCGEMIEYNPEKPYCDKCFASWAKYKNPDYKEKHCHICGEKASTTKIRPVCNECYNKHFRK